MNFDLTEEQQLLRNLIEKYASDRYDPTKRLTYVREPNGFCAEGWQLLADTGVLAFPFAESLCGMGGDGVELITVMEAFGRGVVAEPILSVIVLAGRALERAGTPEQIETWLPKLIDGSAFGSFAHCERESRYNADAIKTRAETNSHGIRLTGTKQLALAGPFADIFIVSAKNNAGRVGLYMIPAHSEGVTLQPYRLADGSVCCDMTLTGTPAEAMPGTPDNIEDVMADARLAICAELLGLMGTMFDATLDYIKMREQFGQSIGSFQAVQHRMADHYARLELCRSHLYRAIGQTADEQGRAAALAGAKAFISQNAMELGEDAIQLHGGIGTTEELLVGQAFKRAVVLSAIFGDSDWELQRYVQITSGTGNAS